MTPTQPASPSPATEKGKWMPKEPTQAMCTAAIVAFMRESLGDFDATGDEVYAAYRAMYEAAPKADHVDSASGDLSIGALDGARALPCDAPKTIESAPKDGTEILAWRADCGWFMARWTCVDSLRTTSDKDRDELDEETLFSEDWFGGDSEGCFRADGSEAPTHWTHLPPDAICQTCDGNGVIGGPSYREPDNGGEPCPDCAAPAAGDAPSGQWDASQIKQPGWNHVQQAFIDGACEARANPDATVEDFGRASDGYTKRVFEEVDPTSEAALRTESWAAPSHQGADPEFACSDSRCWNLESCQRPSACRGTPLNLTAPSAASTEPQAVDGELPPLPKPDHRCDPFDYYAADTVRSLILADRAARSGN